MPLRLPATVAPEQMLNTLRTTLEQYTRKVEAQLGQALSTNGAQQTQITVLQNPVNQLNANIYAQINGTNYLNGNNGFYTLPNNLIVQWGSYIAGNGSTGNGDTVTFPTTYLSNLLSLQVVESNGATNMGLGQPTLHSASPSSTPLTSWLHYCSQWNGSTWVAVDSSYSWLAIGY